MKQTRFTLHALLALALAACQQPADDNIAIESNNLAAADVETLPPSDQAGQAADDGFNLTSTTDGDTSAGMPILPEDAAKATIPAQYRGRWGMVAADCTSTRGDAKGLIAVDDKTIKFYEARATLREQRPAIATSFSGLFGFTGEGQTWERVETLTVTGDRMERRSTTPQGDAGDALTYTRCKA